MKVKVTPHNKSQKIYAKIMDDFLNSDIITPITQNIAMTITGWELLIGKELLQKILRVYLKKEPNDPKTEYDHRRTR